MFAKTIIDSDAFLDMPISARLLYYDLGMRADDEGFVNNPKKITRMIGASDDDLKLLVAKKFLIPFESGVVVIKHWKIHNYIRGDRIHETKYKEERSTLSFDENSSYTQCQSDVSQLSDKCHTEVRLGKVRLGEVSINNSGASPRNFTPPTIEELKTYCSERKNSVDINKWYDFYLSKGWMIGKNKMKDWKAAVRTWEKDSPKPKQENPIDEWK